MNSWRFNSTRATWVQAACSTTGKSTGDLEDTRDVALNNLSNILDVRYFENANGTVTVYTGDGTTLVDSTPIKMAHASLSQVSPSASYANGDFNGIYAGVRDITKSIQGGKMKALIDTRDSILPTMQSQLDQRVRDANKHPF